MFVHTCFNNRSVFGYKSSVLKSGICKYSRRDEYEKMKWCVMELSEFRKDPKGNGLITNLINRLKVVLMEELSPVHVGTVSEMIHLLNEYDASREKTHLLMTFCKNVMKCRKTRTVSYMNSWWREKEFSFEKHELNKILPYRKEGDTDELLLIGENLLHFIETKDERMFGCFFKMMELDSQGRRYRRNDAGYLWYEILCDSMKEPVLKTIFDFSLSQFHKKQMTERNAFAIWIGILVWKKERLLMEEEIIYETQEMTNEYMSSRKKLIIDDYVINDYHVNKAFGLEDFAVNGAYVKNEDLSLLENAKEYKENYIQKKKLKDKERKQKKVSKKQSPKGNVEMKNILETKDNIEFIPWSRFSDIHIIEEGVCGGKVCCIRARYEGSDYILKEMRESMNYGKDAMVIDRCKSLFGLTDTNMRRIRSDHGQVKKDNSLKSFVNNVKIAPKDCIYCMMDYWDNVGDLGKNKDKLTNDIIIEECLRIRLYDGLFRSSDNILRNILVNSEGELLSIDEGDMFGKRKKIFNKHDWCLKNIPKEVFDYMLDEIMDHMDEKLDGVKEQMEIYGFTHYKEFETRLKNYREIVMSEVL